MTHQSLLSLLEDFVDGELSDEEARRVEKMIAESSDIKTEYELSKLVKQILDNKGSHDPGDAYFDELTELIRARTIQRDRDEYERDTPATRGSERRAFVRSLVSAVASLILLFTALFLGSHREDWLSGLNGNGDEIIATASVSRELSGFQADFATAEEQQSLGQGMFLLSPPGMAARFLVFPEYLGQ